MISWNLWWVVVWFFEVWWEVFVSLCLFGFLLKICVFIDLRVYVNLFIIFLDVNGLEFMRKGFDLLVLVVCWWSLDEVY